MNLNKPIQIKFNSKTLICFDPTTIILYITIFSSFLSIWLNIRVAVLLVFLPLIILSLDKKLFIKFLNSNFLLAFFLITSIIFGLFISISQNRFGPLVNVFYLFFSISLAFSLYKKPKVFLNLTKNFLIFIYIWFFISGIYYGFNPNSIDKYITHASRNIVSALFIFATIFLYLAQINYKKDINVIPAIPLLFIAFLSYGRSGIILSIILFLSIYLYNFIDEINFLKIFIFLIAIFILSIILFFYLNTIINNTNLKRGLESIRFKMYLTYLENISLKSFFLGVNLEETIMERFNTMNPHNSFLRMHYNLGLGAISFVILIITYIIKNIFPYFNKQTLLLVMFLMIFIVRSFFDIVAFTGSFDYIFFVNLIMLIENKNKIQIKRT